MALATVFAFGSNMHRPQMQSRCPSATVLGPGILRDFRIGFSGTSRRWNGAVATIEMAPGRRCFGLLYQITESDLGRLDGYEGVYASIYERITVPVHRSTGRPRRAHAYRLCGETKPGLPSTAYLNLIRSAYREWGFDEQDLVDALMVGRRASKATAHRWVNRED